MKKQSKSPTAKAGTDHDRLNDAWEVEGTAQFGMAQPADLILARADGKSVRSIAVIYRRSPIVFFSLADSGISRPEDFVGQTIRSTGTTDWTLRALTNKVGIAPDQYETVYLPSDLARFAKGDIPVWSGFINVFTVVFVGLLSEYIRLLQRESEGRHMLDVILKNIPTGLAVTGGPPNFPIRWGSQYALELNQHDPDKLIGMASAEHPGAWTIFLPDGITQPAPAQLPIYRASHYGEVVRNLEFVMEAEDGRKIPVLVNAAPIRDAQGKIVAAINAWLDISDRKRAEEILIESEKLYRTIARSIPGGGVFVIDRNLRYLIAEGAMIEKLGYSREQLEGHTVTTSVFFIAASGYILQREATFSN